MLGAVNLTCVISSVRTHRFVVCFANQQTSLKRCDKSVIRTVIQRSGTRLINRSTVVLFSSYVYIQHNQKLITQLLCRVNVGRHIHTHTHTFILIFLTSVSSLCAKLGYTHLSLSNAMVLLYSCIVHTTHLSVLKLEILKSLRFAHYMTDQ